MEKQFPHLYFSKMDYLPILVQGDRSGSSEENFISPLSQRASIFTFCLACLRGHVKSITVPCLAGNTELSILIFKAGSAPVQLAISETVMISCSQ